VDHALRLVEEAVGYPWCVAAQGAVAAVAGVHSRLFQEYVLRKRNLGSSERPLVFHNTRDTMVEFVGEVSERTEITLEKIIGWAGISRRKFFDSRSRYGKGNEDNGLVPRDQWLQDDKERRIVKSHDQYPLTPQATSF
jgi:hypothetical protein